MKATVWTIPGPCPENNGLLRNEFTYDGFGRRVRIVEKVLGTVTGTKQFVWVGTQIAEERDGANAVTKRFYADGQINYQPSTLNLFYTRDHLGSVREVTDNSGMVRARYDYDPYGRVTKVSGDVDSDFLYTGHYYHARSGLHLAMYRAYDADLGRWLNRDPIGEAGGINLYGYVGSDPVNYVDPLGLNSAIGKDNMGNLIYFGSAESMPKGYVSPDLAALMRENARRGYDDGRLSSSFLGDVLLGGFAGSLRSASYRVCLTTSGTGNTFQGVALYQRTGPAFFDVSFPAANNVPLTLWNGITTRTFGASPLTYGKGGTLTGSGIY